MRRTTNNAYDLLEDMALNAFNWESKRFVRKSTRVNNIDSYSALVAQIESLRK